LLSFHLILTAYELYSTVKIAREVITAAQVSLKGASFMEMTTFGQTVQIPPEPPFLLTQQGAAPRLTIDLLSSVWPSS
jgi:hypothetical protein